MRFEWNRDLQAGLDLWHRGELDQALERLNRAIRVSPHAALAHFARSHIFWRQDQHLDALEQARRAVELEPCNVEFRLHLGALYCDMPEFGQLGRDYWLGASEAQLHRTVLFDALPSHALGILSHVLEQRGKIAEAADRLLQAIELQPEEPEYYARLVHLLERRSHRAAKDAFHRALTLSRSSPHCMAILKEFLAKGRDNL